MVTLSLKISIQDFFAPINHEVYKVTQMFLGSDSSRKLVLKFQFLVYLIEKINEFGDKRYPDKLPFQ